MYRSLSGCYDMAREVVSFNIVVLRVYTPDSEGVEGHGSGTV
jgi:hypothetical protein